MAIPTIFKLYVHIHWVKCKKSYWLCTQSDVKHGRYGSHLGFRLILITLECLHGSTPNYLTYIFLIWNGTTLSVSHLIHIHVWAMLDIFKSNKFQMPASIYTKLTFQGSMQEPDRFCTRSGNFDPNERQNYFQIKLCGIRRPLLTCTGCHLTYR